MKPWLATWCWRAADMGVELGPDHAPAIARAGAALLAAAREQVPVTHPGQPDVTQISLAMLHGPAGSPGIAGRNSVVLPAGRITAGDERTTISGHEAVVPSIQGRAWITGYTQHILQPDDPFPAGLTVGDIWSTIHD